MRYLIGIMVNSKVRRNSGRYYPCLLDKSLLYLVQQYYDDWNDYRDGQRDRRSKCWKDCANKRKRQYINRMLHFK